jgi:cyclic-di-GMP-binding protein
MKDYYKLQLCTGDEGSLLSMMKFILLYILIKKTIIIMAQQHSFDIVSEVDLQEVDNAINQALKEIHQRYDLKDSKTEIELHKKDKFISVNTRDDYSLRSSFDILQTKFIRRGISVKALKADEPETAAGGRLKQKINLQSGISKENAKKITAMIKETKLKVNAQIQDEQVRVQGAKIDDLQTIIQLIKEAELDFPTQFVNMK